jgi:hypothetical protein
LRLYVAAKRARSIVLHQADAAAAIEAIKPMEEVLDRISNAAAEDACFFVLTRTTFRIQL